MEAKNNQRLKELKLSFYISKIDSIKDKLDYSRIMKLLSCLAGALGREEHSAFTRLTMGSVGHHLLGATDKEIVATIRTFFSKREAAKMLGVSNATVYNRYDSLFNRDYITESYLDSLKSMFEGEGPYAIIDLMLDFIENFKFEVGNNDIDIRDKERTLEIEFWLIYDKLMNILRNHIVCDKFMFNLCNLFDIDYNDVSQLKNNIHLISRQYPNFKYGNRYFMQELVYLYNRKGLSKCQIASKVLNKDSNFLYVGTNQKYNDLIDNDNVEWQYVPTLDWSNLKKSSIMKFIDLFHTFIKYDI